MRLDDQRALDDTSADASGARARHDCGHAGAREIRMYTPYADANGVRLRLQSGDNGWRYVSPLYPIPDGWAWVICNECTPAGARERNPRTARSDRLR